MSEAAFMLPVVLLYATISQAPSAAMPQTPAAPYECTAAAHTELDFWIGEWDVVPTGRALPQGAKPSLNVITKEHKGCVIVERWQSASPPVSGSSFNIYDRSRGEWSQTWVDTNGGLHQYRGRLQNGNMVFLGDIPLPTNARFAGRRTIRMTLFNLGPDKVRQLSESYMPDGTWTVNYDLTYTRRTTK